MSYAKMAERFLDFEHSRTKRKFGKPKIILRKDFDLAQCLNQLGQKQELQKPICSPTKKNNLTKLNVYMAFDD